MNDLQALSRLLERGWPASLVAAGIVALADAFYVGLLLGQGLTATSWSRTVVVAGALLVVAAAFVGGVFIPWDGVRVTVVVSAVLASAVLGLVSIMSIGLLLLLAALVGSIGARKVIQELSHSGAPPY